MSHAWCLHHRKCRFTFCRFCWIIHRWCKAKRDECMVGCAKHDLSAGLWTLWSPFMIKTHDDRVDQVYIDHSESAFPREDKISTSYFFFLGQHHALEALGTRKRCPELAAYGNVKIQSLYFVKAAVSCPLTMVSVMRASTVFTVRIQRFPDRTIKLLYYKNRS